jgi:hypothetical protein
MPYLKVEVEVEGKQYSLSNYSVLFNDMELHYKTLLKTLPGVVYALNEEGYFAFISDNIQKLLGYEPNDLIGSHFSTIVHPDDISAVSKEYILPKFYGISTGNDMAPKLFDERRSPERRTNGLRIRLLYKKNKHDQRRSVFCDVNSSGQHEICNSRKFLGTVGMLYDFSEEDAIDDIKEKKEKYNPFELFSQAIRHRLSNLFTGIYGNLQLIEMQIEKNKDFKPNLDAIKNSVEKAVESVNQFSNAISEPSLKKKQFTPDMVVMQVAKELFEQRNIVLDFKVGQDLLKFEIDSDYAKHITRSILFLIRENVGSVGKVQITTMNAGTLPPEIPRLDCKYILVRVEIECESESGGVVPISSELNRVADTSLGYLLLKKNGGLVKVLSECAVALYLPATE